MNAIVVVDKKWGIGKNNDLLFKLPEDMKYFRQKTLNKIVVMGSNTLKSFPDGKPAEKPHKRGAFSRRRKTGRLYRGGQSRRAKTSVDKLPRR